MLWLAWHFPDLPLEIFSRGMSGTMPLIVTEQPGRQQKVLRANSAARHSGIAPGMRVGAALALAEALQVIHRDSRAEQHALRRLAAWAGQYSSRIYLSSAHILLLEIGGSERLFGDLTQLVAGMQSGIRELGYEAQWALAPTKLAASWFARLMPETRVTETERLIGVLSQLPLSVLGLAPRELARLQGMGLKRIGDCLRLPRAGLAKRMGPQFMSLLDRACGRLPDPRDPFVPDACFESRLELPASVERVEALAFGVKRLMMELCGELRGQGAGIIKLILRLAHPRLAATVIELGLVTPSRDAEHLLRLFNERLAQTVLPEPVEALVLKAPTYLPLDVTTVDLFDSHPGSTQSIATLIERLRARLGQQAVQGLQVVDEHRPERAYALQPTNKPGTRLDTTLRPLWLLPEPLRLDQYGDCPWLGSALVLHEDIERIESGWWDGADIRRDYFVAHNANGEYYWIFRELRPPHRWWLHGIFA